MRSGVASLLECQEVLDSFSAGMFKLNVIKNLYPDLEEPYTAKRILDHLPVYCGGTEIHLILYLFIRYFKDTYIGPN